MRVLAKVSIPVEAGNRAIKDGSLPQILDGFMSKTKPETAFFGLDAGKRTVFVVFDLASPADIPPLFEPLFMGFDAQVDIQPVMDAADLQKGLSSLG
jgi:hypothetical protein